MTNPPPLADSARHAPSPPATLAGNSIFFDFDGTLVELAGSPDAVVVGAPLLHLLDRLNRRIPGRLAIVSGRSVAQLDALIGDFASSVAVAGSHGAEQRMPGGPVMLPPRSPALDAACEALEAWAQPRALLTERKTLGTALHYRQQPQWETEAVATGEALAARFGVTLQRGKMMIELRSAGDKGLAITALLQTPAMAGTHPLFFGDDVTDEDGFVAAAAAGGAGVLIGEPRPTAARYRLGNVSALHAWIAQALEGR